MRIFYSVVIAFLFTIMNTEFSSVHAMEPFCPDMKQMGRAMDMAKCCRSSAPEAAIVGWGNATQAMADCCPLDECGRLLIGKELALNTTSLPAGFTGIVQTPAFSQPMALALLGVHRTGLPPPRLPSTPAYIQHCSLLI